MLLNITNLWRHPTRRPHKSLRLVPHLISPNQTRDPEISQLHLTMLVQQNILSLDIPMNALLVVEVGQAGQHFLQNDGDGRF